MKQKTGFGDKAAVRLEIFRLNFSLAGIELGVLGTGDRGDECAHADIDSCGNKRGWNHAHAHSHEPDEGEYAGRVRTDHADEVHQTPESALRGIFKVGK